MDWLRRHIHHAQASQHVKDITQRSASPPDTGFEASVSSSATKIVNAILSVPRHVRNRSASANAGNKHEQVARVTVTFHKILHVPQLGLDSAFGCRLKPIDPRSLLEPQDSPLFAAGYRNQVTFEPPWEIKFKCILSQQTAAVDEDEEKDSAGLDPVMLKLSIRKYKRDSENFKKFGYVFINVSEYAKVENMGNVVTIRKLVEDCAFNSIVEFSVKIESLEEFERSKRNLSKLLINSASRSRNDQDYPELIVKSEKNLTNKFTPPERQNKKSVEDLIIDDSESTLVNLVLDYEKQLSAKTSSETPVKSLKSKRSASLSGTGQKPEVSYKLNDQPKTERILSTRRTSGSAFTLVDDLMDSVAKKDGLSTEDLSL